MRKMSAGLLIASALGFLAPQPALAAADLVVETLEFFTNENLQQTEITATIKNIGDTDAFPSTALLALVANRQEIHQVNRPVLRLKPGESSRELTSIAPFVPQPGQSFCAYAIADVRDKVAEDDEGNNEKWNNQITLVFVQHRSIQIELPIYNPGSVADHVELSIGAGLPFGWTAQLDPPSLNVPAGSVAVTTLRLTPPSAAWCKSFRLAIAATYRSGFGPIDFGVNFEPLFTPECPTLGTWGLITLTGLLAFGSVRILKRREEGFELGVNPAGEAP